MDGLIDRRIDGWIDG